MFKILPEPDKFGNFWFYNGKYKVIGCAIFPAKNKKAPYSTFILTLGKEEGFVWERDDYNEMKFKYYYSPEEALIDLNLKLKDKIK